MGFFDFFKPGKGRGAPKPKPRPRGRNYQAGEASRLTNSWSRTPTTADAEIYRSLRPIRARSREQSRNNGYMRRFLTVLRSNVIGPNGVVLQSRVTTKRGKLRPALNDSVEAAFRAWRPDYQARLTWLQMQNLALSTVAEDGEVIAEKVITADGPRLLLIDPELLDVEHNEDRPDGYIRMGIEHDARGRRTAYYFRDDATPSSLWATGYEHGGRKYRRVPAARIIHAYLPDRIGQTRGVPWAAPIMWRARMLDGYEDAAVTAARVGASKMGFFTSVDGKPYTGEEDSEGNVLMDSAEPGAFETLPEGTSFMPFDPDYPHAQFEVFVKAMLRGVSSGLGISYNTLANDLEGVNYSSIRAGVMEDREAWKALQQWFIESFVRDAFEFWLSVSLARGDVLLHGRPVSPDDEAVIVSSASWQPRRWSWVDPLKDIQAHKAAYDMGATSLSAIIRETGRDPEDVWRERQREQEVMGQYGVSPAEAEAGAFDEPEHAE